MATITHSSIKHRPRSTLTTKISRTSQCLGEQASLAYGATPA